MDIQPNFLNNSPATPPHKSISHWFVVSLAIIAVIGYFMTSYYYALWPFESLIPQIQPLSPVKTLGPAPSPSDELDTSTWQTYRNEEYGFELILDNNFKNYQTVIGRDIDGTIIFFCLPVSKRTNPEMLRDENCDTDNSFANTIFYIGVYTKYQYNNIIKELRDPIIGEKNDLMFTYRKQDAEILQGYGTTQTIDIDQILSTFRFIDKTDTSNWQTYRNEEYGFEFRYPLYLEIETIESESLVALKPPALSKGDAGYPGPVQIQLYKNQKNLTLREFFDGKNAPDLFTGTQETINSSIGGKQTIVFKNVGGLVSSDVIVVALSNQFLAITHLNIAGINQVVFDQILSTFHFLR